jgi:hypothetical protein
MNQKLNPASRDVAILPVSSLVLAVFVIAIGCWLGTPSSSNAQTVAAEAGGIRVGERLTFNVSTERVSNVAYAELYAVSRGRIGDKDAIEVRSKMKTLDLASATHYLIDETRTTFVSPSSGLPLYVSVTQNAFGLPRETISNFLSAPSTNFDLSTAMYKIRQLGGNGSLTLQENDRVYSFTFQAGAAEKHKTEAGEFDTALVSIQSDYFTELGLTDVRLNLSSDENRLPVLLRFRTTKGHFKVALASVQIIEPDEPVQPTPTPARTPVVERTPKPVATPTPYVANQPLPAELAFDIGETLEYRIVTGGQPIGRMRMSVKERTQVNGIDTLILEAVFAENAPGSPFVSGDFIRANVDPETLAPYRIEIRFAGQLKPFSQTAVFDRQRSSISFGGATPAEAPVGTHSILSLLYAARSFNLKPSRDLNNPINDTRVAVFWESRAYVFTLRPSPPEVIKIDGKDMAAQMVAINTKNPTLDQQNIKVWLGNDDARIPLRFSVGPFQAELISATKIQPK